MHALATHARPPSRRRVADLVADPRHAGPLGGADAIGEAHAGDRVVRVAVWRAPGGGVARARFAATSCASLIAYAEAACALVEAGTPAAALAAALPAAVAGVHPMHRDRADLVTAALCAALTRSEPEPP